MTELDHAYWRQRWETGEIGWSQTEVTPWLRKYWPALGLDGQERVLVPFCGKTLDMVWFAEQGHEVLGGELSPLAIQDFFDEQELVPETTAGADGLHHRAGRIEIIEGDLFGVPAATLAGCSAVFDRGALVAQTPEQRRAYLRRIYGALPVGSKGLLLTIDYPQAEKAGPPFAVTETELRGNLPGWRIERLDRRDMLEGQADFMGGGLSRLHAEAWHLTRER